MRRSLNIKTQYLDKWSNKPCDVYCNSYLLNIVFPSVSRSVPYKLRVLLRDFSAAYNDYCCLVGNDNQFTDMWLQLKTKYSEVFYFPNGYKSDFSYSWHDLSSFILDCWSKLQKFLNLELDISLIQSLAFKRNLFLSKLSLYSPVVNLSDKLYVIRKKFARSASLEKF